MYARRMKKILDALKDGKPRTARQIISLTGLNSKNCYEGLRLLWHRGRIYRSRELLFIKNIKSGGRFGGIIQNTRAAYLYIINNKFPDLPKNIVYENTLFVPYSKEYLDYRGIPSVKGTLSKFKKIELFLKQHADKAFYAREIRDALKDEGITAVDVSTAIRRLERKSLILKRGFRTHDSEKPFRLGYLVTWITRRGNLLEDMEQAEEKIRQRLKSEESSTVVWNRVLKIYQTCKSFARDKKLVSWEFLRNKLGCNKWELDYALRRALEFYSEIKEIRIFDVFRYYYHTDLQDPYLSAAIENTKNYIRQYHGRYNRIGHNYEACISWFFDKFTNATFLTQNHRSTGKNKMDPRRITIHLIKPVAGRQQSAELDRVWFVKPDIFSNKIMYILECKWGVVRKRHIDDLVEILKWSKEFGVDGPDGRTIKNGVVVLFAASSFSNEKVKLGDKELSLAEYAALLNITLLKTADFNKMLHEHGASTRVSIQKIAKFCKNEEEVKETLDKIWSNPKKAEDILQEVAQRNFALFEFERKIESKK